MTAAMLGTVALWGAVGSCLAALLPRIDAPRARRALVGAAILASASVAFLAAALLATDLSIAYVAETTSRATPWPYRLAAVWGGMDGSMLFYAASTLVVGAIGARRLAMGRTGVRVVAVVGVGFLLITALIANPFHVLDIPAVDGRGLLGILQHPAMIYHPPILYLGLVTLVVPAAITVEAALEGRADGEWLTRCRRWMLVSWVLLTLGMVAGASWAYVELGWGGFWAWDPVENTALMPWLAITAFLHISRLQHRDGRFRRLGVFLVLASYSLTILGVYLTRSGSTGSIHAFAESPLIGEVLLSASLVAVTAAFALAARMPRGARWLWQGWHRDGWIALSVALVLLALVFVTVGSAYPAFVAVFTARTVGVDSAFFTTTVAPIALVVAALLGVALGSGWSGVSLDRRDVVVVVVTGIGVAALGSVRASVPRLVPIALMGLAAGSLFTLVPHLRAGPQGLRSLFAPLAHIGMAMILVGAGGSGLGSDHSGVMSPGDQVSVGGHDIVMTDLITGKEDRFVFAEAVFELDGRHTLRPQIRAYEDQTLPIAEPAIHSTPGRDVIVAVSLLFPEATAADVSVFVRPMVWWVWAGALVLALAGSLALVSTVGGGAGRRPGARARPRRADTTSGTSAR